MSREDAVSERAQQLYLRDHKPGMSSWVNANEKLRESYRKRAESEHEDA